MPKEIVGEEEITLPQVKKLLSKRGKESELSFQQSITLEHASTFAKMAPAVATKLVARLMKNYELSRFQAVQIVNIAPINVEELKTILDTRSSDLTEEQLGEIVDIIASNRS
ncbi:MAG: RNA polymerase Rpb4 family protein [Candidatus Thorarchaeota archaeon]|jgi:DNA-directed RNA polymerase subunit F